MTTLGFKFIDHICEGRSGGGTAYAGEKSSFEYSEWVVNCGSRKLKILTIYRIPYSVEHPITTSTFFTHLQVTWNQ